MKKGVIKSVLLPLGISAFVVLFMSSCQRGYGCPYKMQAKVEANK